MSMTTLIIPITSKEQLGAVYKAEQYLLKAGVEFDTGSLLAEGRVQERPWELDWSLKGATLTVRGNVEPGMLESMANDS